MSNRPAVSVSIYPSSLNQLVAISTRYNAPLEEVLHDVLVNGVSQTVDEYETRSGGARSSTSLNSYPRPNGMDYR